MTGFRSFNNSTCKIVLNVLKMGYLRPWEVAENRITVIKLGMNDGVGDGTGCRCCRIKVRTATASLRNMTIAAFRET